MKNVIILLSSRELLFLMLCLLFATPAGAADSTYTNENAYEEEFIPSWAESEIEKVKEAGIMVGKDDGKFHPYDAINRAQIVTILLRMKEEDGEPRAEQHSFADVPSGAWYEEALNLSLSKEWVKGRTATTFEPSRKMNRAEFAVLLVRAFEIDVEEESKMQYKDVSENDWYHEAVNALYVKELVRYPYAFSYDPERKVSRAEAAWVLSRIMDKPGLFRTEEAPPTFVGGSPRNSKKVSIRPRDFNADKQGFEATKLGTTIGSNKNNPEVVVQPGGEAVYLGEILLSNSLTEDVNVQSVVLQLDFLEGKAGPEENFTLEIRTETETKLVDITREKQAQIHFTEMLVEVGAEVSFQVYISAREDESYLFEKGSATVFLADIEAFFYDPNRNDKDNYINDIPSSSPLIYDDRYLGTFNFDPTKEEEDVIEE